jgi:hypothetical protein
MSTQARPDRWQRHWRECIESAADADVTLFYAAEDERNAVLCSNAAWPWPLASKCLLSAPVSGLSPTTSAAGASTASKPQSVRSRRRRLARRRESSL